MLLLVGCEVIVVAVGIPTYNKYVRKAYASGVELAIKNIIQASELYKLSNGDYPPDCWETMEAEGFIDIPESITREWIFECYFDEYSNLGKLYATSTDEMPGGPGRMIEYDKETGVFTGYGQSGFE